MVVLDEHETDSGNTVRVIAPNDCMSLGHVVSQASLSFYNDWCLLFNDEQALKDLGRLLQWAQQIPPRARFRSGFTDDIKSTIQILGELHFVILILLNDFFRPMLKGQTEIMRDYEGEQGLVRLDVDGVIRFYPQQSLQVPCLSSIWWLTNLRTATNFYRGLRILAQQYNPFWLHYESRDRFAEMMVREPIWAQLEPLRLSEPTFLLLRQLVRVFAISAINQTKL